MWNFAFYLFVAIIALLLRFGTFIVYEGSQVVITQFGAIVGTPYDQPGLYFRLPFIHQTNYLDSRIQTWSGFQNYVPTRDKLYVGVETVAHWRIRDPGLFLETLETEKAAISRLDSILNGAVKDAIAAHALVDAVRSTNNVLANRGKSEMVNDYADLTDGMAAEMEDEILTDLEWVNVGRIHLSNKMLQMASADAAPLGIEVMNVFIKRINYHPPVERMVFERMISERHRVAERLRSIGRSESERIRGELAEDIQAIVAPAAREAELIKGRADAEATRIYAETFGQDEDFYRFWRTLTAYRHALPENAEIVGSLDSSFFRMLREREIPSVDLTPVTAPAAAPAAGATALEPSVAEPEPERSADSEAAPEAGPVPAADPETDPETDPGTGPGTEPKPDPDLDAAAALIESGVIP